MANKRDLLDKALEGPRKSDCLQFTEDKFCYDKRPPSFFHDQGPDGDDDDDDNDDDDDDDDNDNDDNDDDEDEDDEDEDEEEEDRLASKTYTHYASDYHANSLMSHKITKQFCNVHHIDPSSAKRCQLKKPAKTSLCNTKKGQNPERSKR